MTVIGPRPVSRTAHPTPSAGISCPRTTKPRGRPLGITAGRIREAILDDLVGRYDRMTVRQVFYQLEVKGVVKKTEGGYRQVQTQVLALRRQGVLDWSFITDGTRWQRKPDTWSSSEEYIQAVARNYRRDLWRNQNYRIEFWLEKDALADIVTDITSAWDVSLMVSRGQSSATFLQAAAKTAERHYRNAGTVTRIYTMYDHDAGGERSARTIRRDLPELAGIPVLINEIAVTAEQIMAWSLPTRPAKQSDPEAKKWGDRPAVELDAIPPDQLRELVRNAIIENVDPVQWEIEKTIETEELDGLRRLAEPAA
jgi:hypothetical protein